MWPPESSVSILASESLFRVGLLAELTGYTIFLVLPVVLYSLLSPVSRGGATLMVVFALVSVPISVVAVLHKFDLLALLHGPLYRQAFTTDQVQAQVMRSLDAYRSGLLVSEIFWGLWLLPFGFLVYKSGSLPRILGILLMLGCFGYLIDFLGTVLSVDYPGSTLARFVRIPGSSGELGTCLWLLIVGGSLPRRRVG